MSNFAKDYVIRAMKYHGFHHAVHSLQQPGSIRVDWERAAVQWSGYHGAGLFTADKGRTYKAPTHFRNRPVSHG